MIKMNALNTPRYLSFSKEDQDVVKAGVDLYKHRLFLEGKKEYAEFAKDMSYEEKHDKFNKALLTQSVVNAGFPASKASDTKVFMKTNVREETFALVSEILDIIVPNTVLNDFYRIAETKNVAWGDNLKFTVPNPNLFVVSKLGNGIRQAEPQRLFDGDVVLTPEVHAITVEEDFYRIVSGKVDWGMVIAKVAQSIETQISVDVYNAIFNSYANLDTNLKEAGFTQTAFVKLAQRIEALNRGSKVYVMGTRSALATVIPSDDYLKFPLGAEYNALGYLGNFHGVEMLEIPQKIAINTLDFAISDNRLFFFSMASDKPVKVGFEGETLMFQTSDANTNADMTINYTIQKKWEAKVATSSRYGIMQVS